MELSDLVIINTKILLVLTGIDARVAMGSRYAVLQLRCRRVYSRVADEVAEKFGGEVGLR